MTKAKLVVLRLGNTPGFWWEVEQSVSKIDPTRLLLVVPFGRKKYRAFAEKAAQYFRHPLPAYSARRNWLGIRYTRSLGTLRGSHAFIGEDLDARVCGLWCECAGRGR